MKKILFIFMFICIAFSVLGALDTERYLCFWLKESASTHDKLAIRDGFETLFNDNQKINWNDLPHWRVKANTNVVGRTLVVAEANLIRFGVNPDKVTLSAFNTWKINNLDDPNCLYVRRGIDWYYEFTNAGLEKIIIEVEP